METQLENIAGRLIDTYSQFQPETIQHSYEIQNDRRLSKCSKNNWFWTADFPMYKAEGKEPVLYMADRSDNLIFQNIEEAIKQIRASNNYKPTEQGIKAVLLAVEKGNAEKFALSDLKLKKHDDEFSYFEINTAKPEKLNEGQLKYAKRVHGRTDSDFSANMKMLNDAKIDNTRVYFLNPKYVLEQLKDNKDKAIARASGLLNFDINSNFIAVNRLVDYVVICLRGVRKVAEGDVAKNLEQKAEKSTEHIPYVQAYQAVISQPDSLTPEMAHGLSELLTKYLGKAKQ